MGNPRQRGVDLRTWSCDQQKGVRVEALDGAGREDEMAVFGKGQLRLEELAPYACHWCPGLGSRREKEPSPLIDG